MGWLEGLLTGYQQRHYAIEADKRREAELAAIREGRAFETLLNSKYPDIKHLAAAGILDSANPRKKKGGFAGWMGEMSTSPYLPAIQRYQEMLGPEGEEEDLQPPAPAPQPQAIPTPPPPTGSAAMPATPAQTQAGSPPLTPTQPTAPQSPLLPTFTPGSSVPGVSQVGTGQFGRDSSEPEPPPAFEELHGVRFAPPAYQSPFSLAPPAPPAAAPSFMPPQGMPNQGPILSPLQPGQPQPQLAPGAAGGPPAPPAQAAAPAAAQAAGAAGMTAMPAGTQPAAGLPQPGANATTPPPALPGAPVAAATPQLGALPPGPRPITTLSSAPPPRPRRTTLLPTVLPGGRSVFPTQADLKEQAAMADVTGDVKGWQEIYRLSGEPDWEQKGIQAALQQKLGRGAQAPYQSLDLEYEDPVTHQIVRTSGSYNKTTGQYVDDDLLPIPGRVVRAMPYSALGMGTYANRAMNMLNVSVLDVRNDPVLATQVNQLARQLQQDAGYSSALGGRQGVFAGPMPPEKAIELGQRPGVTGTDLQRSGALFPTPDQRDLRRTMELVKTQVVRIGALSDAALPSESSYQGMAPGVASAVRASTYMRKEYTQLTAAVNEVINMLARSAGQRGPQTEKDAERAEAVLVSFRDKLMAGLSDPLGGDTMESARLRVSETISYLDRILATLPVNPQVVPGSGAAAAGGPPVQGGGAPGAADPLTGTAAPSDIPSTGAYVRNGRRYWNGKDIGAAR